ncbi:MAG: DUF4837 family protein [Bacteroidales bacterium]|jgi:hypothetical protein|nr:DUF4837 family protein [Bacteroidales bacterium]
MKMNKLTTLILYVMAAFVFTVLTSCDDQPGRILPPASGKAGEIAVISPRSHWEAEPGTTIRSFLAAEYAHLPQKEPTYTLFNVPPKSFNKVFQVHRNLLNIIISDTVSNNRIGVSRDVWAKSQIMISVYAKDEESSAKLISDNADKILSYYENAERNRVIQNAKNHANPTLKKYVTTLIGGSPYFPRDYTEKMHTNNFIWISYETSYTNQGIFVYTFPYQGEWQLTPEYLVARRDEFLKENVPATSENSYMITHPTAKPGFVVKEYNDLQFIEMRGLWDTHNDFMGGPFVSHTYVSPDNKNVVVIEGFVYAPKYEKRNYLRQVEYIISSFEWGKEE